MDLARLSAGTPEATRTPTTKDAGLVRAIGTASLAAGIVNITVGGGIFALPAFAAASLGAAAPLAYLACAVVMGLVVLCFAEAGSRVSATGGPYAYVESALGRYAGFIGGVLLWLTASFASSALSVAFIDSAARLLPALDGDGAKAATLVVAVALLAGVNVTGVRRGARLNTALTAVKLLPLLLLVAAGAFAVRAENLRPGPLPGPDEVSRTAVFLIFAFCGIEAALAPSGEVRDPERTVPRAIGLAMTGIACLYIATQLVAQGILGPDLARETAAPLAEAAGRGLGAPWRALLLVGATVSIFGSLGGFALAVPRILFAFARDGFLPRAFAAVHPRFRTPHVAIAAQSALTVALALSSSFARLAILANLATLVLYALCCIAAWRLRRRDVRAEGEPLRVPGGGAVAPLACLGIAWMLTGIRPDEWAAVAGCVAVASLVYVIVPRARPLA